MGDRALATVSVRMNGGFLLNPSGFTNVNYFGLILIGRTQLVILDEVCDREFFDFLFG
jgi:hypothetical protein